MSKCIIIPAFNEYENINLLLSEIYKTNLNDLIIIIIDDSDKSFEKKIKIQKDRLIYLYRGKKLGRGSAVLYGIKHALDTFDDIDLFIQDFDYNNEVKPFTIQVYERAGA